MLQSSLPCRGLQSGVPPACGYKRIAGRRALPVAALDAAALGQTQHAVEVFSQVCPFTAAETALSYLSYALRSFLLAYIEGSSSQGV